MNELIDRFTSYLKNEKRFSEHTYSNYQKDLEVWSGFMVHHLGISDVNRVEGSHMRSYLVWMKTEKNYKPASLRRKFSAIKSFYAFLEKTGESSINPTVDISLPKIPKKIPKFLTPKQIDELLDEDFYDEGWEGRQEKLIIEMLLLTGIRRGELIDVKSQDVDASANQLRVFGKGGKERIIPLSMGFISALQEFENLKVDNGVLSSHLFATSEGKKMTGKQVYNIAHKHISRCTTLDQKSPHVLRHSFATLLSNGGANLQIVKELLGHSSLASTQVYTHSSIEQLKKVYTQAHPKGKK